MWLVQLTNQMQPKVILTSLTVDMYTINVPKYFSLVWTITMEWRDKENHVAIIALHKLGIERAYCFELLKPLNVMLVFVYHAFKLFLNRILINYWPNSVDNLWRMNHARLTRSFMVTYPSRIKNNLTVWYTKTRLIFNSFRNSKLQALSILALMKSNDNNTVLFVSPLHCKGSN